jgi:hypothetical protein
VDIGEAMKTGALWWRRLLALSPTLWRGVDDGCTVVA